MNSSPYLHGNLKVMVSGNCAVAKWLAAQNPDFAALSDRIVANSRTGSLDWRIDDEKTLFAKVIPAMVYTSWVSKDDPVAGVTIIVGSNLGYGINRVLSEALPTHKIYVIEPDPAMLMACLGQTDYTPFLTSGRLTFLPPDREAIAKALQQCDVAFLFGKIRLHVDLPSQQLGPQYAQWHRVCRELLENLTIELSTLRHRQDTMVGNELSNYPRAMADGSLKPLLDTAHGLSAVLYGAGPSLAEFGPRIAAAQSYCLHVGALQTLPALQNVGIKPHFCMAIDYSEGMRNVYARLDRDWAADIPLLYSTKLDPEVLAAYPGPTIPLWTLGGMASYVMKDHELVLDAGGNVSVALSRLLTLFGVDRILLVGQDFAWKGDASHATGHHAGGGPTGINPKFIINIKDADGNTIHSALSYTSALRDMERDIAKTQTRYYNLYGGGAVIGGSHPVDMNQVLLKGLLASEPGSLDRFLTAFAAARRPNQWPPFEPRAPRWTTDLRNLQKRLDKLFKKPEKNQADIHAAFQQARVFVRQDPLYLPYLFNEVMEVTALVQARIKYTPQDAGLFKQLTKRILTKVRRIDTVFSGRSDARETETEAEHAA
ncbi:MAG: motility associated factor glycosyltransferase family protein [Desulfovibrionaceae bacterium]